MAMSENGGEFSHSIDLGTLFSVKPTYEGKFDVRF